MSNPDAKLALEIINEVQKFAVLQTLVETLLSSRLDGEATYRFPGVYALAYSGQHLAGKRIMPKDVFYVGMSNSVGGYRLSAEQGNDDAQGRFG